MFSGLDNIISAAHSSTYYRRSNNTAAPDRRVICNSQSETLMAKWDKTMKLWHKILLITTAIVPFAVIALAWQYATQRIMMPTHPSRIKSNVPALFIICLCFVSDSGDYEKSVLCCYFYDLGCSQGCYVQFDFFFRNSCHAAETTAV